LVDFDFVECGGYELLFCMKMFESRSMFEIGCWVVVRNVWLLLVEKLVLMKLLGRWVIVLSVCWLSLLDFVC